MRSRISYSNVVATLALFVAIGGTSYAVSNITSGDVVNGSLKNKDLKKETLTSSRVKDASLEAKDFKANELPAGPQGPAGEAATKLWAVVRSDFGTPTLIRGSGATSVAPVTNGRVRVNFNQNVSQCAYTASAWLEGGSTDFFTDAPTMVPHTGTANTAVQVDTYLSNGLLDGSGNFDFSLAVFC